MNAGNKLKISIVTIVKNRAEFIRDAIENVLSQGYENFEHIVIDGASTDGTLEIIRSYPHLIWVSEPDAGSVFALNKGLRLITGEIFGWLNSDELYEPNLFHEINNQFIKNPSVEVIYGTTEFISSDKSSLGFTRYKKFNLNNEILGYLAITAPSAVFVRGSGLEKIGRRVDEQWKDAYDHDLWIRLGKVCEFKGFNRQFSKFTLHLDSGVASDPDRGLREARLIRLHHGANKKLINRLILIPLVDALIFIYKNTKFKKMTRASKAS